MPSNPYITVPAGTTAQQNMWLQTYYRNLALRDQYAQQQAQQPDWGSALGQGLTSGIGAGLQQYFGTLDTQAKYDQQWQLQMQQEQARAEAQQRLFEQQSAMETLRAQQAQIAKLQELQRLGTARTQFETGMQPTVTPQPDLVTQTSVGGAEPPVLEQGVEQPPATYTDVLRSPQAPQVTRPTVGNVLGQMHPALAGLVPEEMIAAYRKAQTETALKSEDIKRYVDLAYGAADRGDYVTALQFAKSAGLSPAALLEQDPVKRAAMLEAQLKTQVYEGRDVSGMSPEVRKGLGIYVEPKSYLTGQSTVGVLQSIVNATSDADPVFKDPLARVYGNTPTEMRENARRTLYGSQPPQTGGLFGYESALAGARGYATGVAGGQAQLDIPLQEKAQFWINPTTLAAAPSGWTGRQALDAGYVRVDPAQSKELDAIRETVPLTAHMRRLYDPSVIGPGMGRFNTVLEMVNAAPQEFADLRAATERYRASAGRAAAGAAIGPAEREIYFATYPVVTMSPQQFQATLAMVETGLRITRGRILGGQAAPPATPEVPVGQEVTLEGQRVIIERANPDGSLTVRDPITRQSGTWRPR